LWRPADDIDTTLLKGKQTASEQRQDERDQAGINKIVDALRKDGPATARQLRGRTGLSRERQQRLLDLLQSENQLTATSITIRGNQTNEYALPKTEE
jgi:hypothetical protein